MDLGDKISEARKKKGLTQKELGALLHVSDKVVSKWETGKALPDLDMFKSISKVLDINIDEVFDKVELKPKTSQLFYDVTFLQYLKFILINIFVLILGIIIYSSGYNIASGNTYFNATIFEIFKLIKDLLCIISVISEIVLTVNYLIASKNVYTIFNKRNIVTMLVISFTYLIVFLVAIGLGHYIFI